MCILFLPFDRCYTKLPCYLYSSDIFCLIYGIWRWYFFNLFLICTFKDPNLVENLTNLAENLWKNELYRVHGVCFFLVWLMGDFQKTIVRHVCLVWLVKPCLRPANASLWTWQIAKLLICQIFWSQWNKYIISV